MDDKIRNPKNNTHLRIIRSLGIIVLSALLLFYIFFYKEINSQLYSRKPTILSIEIWSNLLKLLSYIIIILINSGLFLVITGRIQSTLIFLYTSLCILILGMIFFVLKYQFHLSIPLVFLAFLVNLNKSCILLILFTAGFIVEKSLSKS